MTLEEQIIDIVQDNCLPMQQVYILTKARYPYPGPSDQEIKKAVWRNVRHRLMEFDNKLRVRLT